MGPILGGVRPVRSDEGKEEEESPKGNTVFWMNQNSMISDAMPISNSFIRTRRFRAIDTVGGASTSSVVADLSPLDFWGPAAGPRTLSELCALLKNIRPGAAAALVSSFAVLVIPCPKLLKTAGAAGKASFTTSSKAFSTSSRTTVFVYE